MSLLLHICCGPCLIYPFQRLKEKGFEVKGLFYNPNIYPLDEYNKRKEALEVLNQGLEFEIQYPKNQLLEFSQAIGEKKEIPQRCLLCWSLRLRKAASVAKENNIQAFSTTLLVSPYQNHELLKQVGECIAKDTGVDFYYEDFRPGFKQAQAEAKVKGLYRQKYCGCVYSKKISAESLCL